MSYTNLTPWNSGRIRALRRALEFGKEHCSTNAIRFWSSLRGDSDMNLLHRREFLLTSAGFFGASACGASSERTGAILRRPISLFDSILASGPLLVVVHKDGSASDIWWTDFNERKDSKVLNLRNAVAVSRADFGLKPGARDDEGRIALLSDGSVATWTEPGREPKFYDAQTVVKALGHKMRQYQDGYAVLTDGKVREGALQLLNGEKLETIPNDDPAAAEIVDHIKLNYAFCRSGNVYLGSILLSHQDIIDAAVIGSRLSWSNEVVLTRNGSLMSVTVGNPPAFRPFTALRPLPAQSFRQIAGTPDSLWALDVTGHVWKVQVRQLNRPETNDQPVANLPKVLAIETCTGRVAVLCADGAVWTWKSSYPVADIKPEQVADDVLLP